MLTTLFEIALCIGSFLYFVSGKVELAMLCAIMCELVELSSKVDNLERK